MNSRAVLIAAAIALWVMPARALAQECPTCDARCTSSTTGTIDRECRAACVAQAPKLCALSLEPPARNKAPARHRRSSTTASPPPAPPPPPPAPPPPPPAPPPEYYPPAPPPTPRPEPQRPSPPPVPERGPTAGMTGESAPIATRLFTDASFDIPRDFGAIAVLVLPNEAALDPAREAAVCRAFVGVFDESGAVAKAAPHREQMVTIWPVNSNARQLQGAISSGHDAVTVARLCPFAVQDYDYLQASGWLAKGPRGFGHGRGPFLIAWAPASSAGDSRAPILTYDLSRVDSDASLMRAMKIWKDEIENDPSLWKGGWDLTRWRLATAASVDHFGAQIGAAMKLVPWLGGGSKPPAP